MVVIELKPDTPRSGRLPLDEYQGIVQDGIRWRMAARPHAWRPPTDVYETETTVVIRVEIAGMQEDDFAISLEDRAVIVRGVRQDTTEKRAYQQMEIPFGEFSTEVDLHCSVSSEGIEALYRDGFLFITLLKVRPRQIRVEDKSI